MLVSLMILEKKGTCVLMYVYLLRGGNLFDICRIFWIYLCIFGNHVVVENIKINVICLCDKTFYGKMYFLKLISFS